MPDPSHVLIRTAQAGTMPRGSSRERLLSLDALRGFVMLAMASEGLGIAHVANQFPHSRWWRFFGYQTDHVAWVGCAAWDLIQPAFMFMVGVSMAYSYAARAAKGQTYGQMARHAAARAVLLAAIGTMLRSNGKLETNWIFTDVLTQIGLGYFSLFLLWGRPAWLQFAAAVLILLGDWLLFVTYPLPPSNFDYAAVGVPADWHHLTGLAAHWDKNSNVAWAFDGWFMNLWPRSTPFKFNPGGYTTLNFAMQASSAGQRFGLLAGELLRSSRSASDKMWRLLLWGAAALVVGKFLDVAGICPIVKRLWSPSWTIFSTGWVLWLLAGFYLVIDLWQCRRWVMHLIW